MEKFESIPFTKARKNISLLLEEAKKKHVIHAVFEVDITEARKIIRKEKKRGHDISFTAWIIKCMAELMKEEKIFNSIRHGRKIIIFEDVDVAIPVERKFDDYVMPVAYIVRKANEKSLDEITEEIRMAQKMELNENEQVASATGLEKFVINLPSFIQKLLLKLLGRNAFLRKKHFGTTAATAIGMMGFDGWLFILGGHYTTQIAIGGISKKIVKNENKIEERDFLRMVVSVDHDIIDGAPLARFVSKLQSMLKNAVML